MIDWFYCLGILDRAEHEGWDLEAPRASLTSDPTGLAIADSRRQLVQRALETMIKLIDIGKVESRDEDEG